jgi:spoIIIJ-associated protein
MDYVEKEALSVPEAVFSGARALGIDEKDAQVQVLSAPGARRVKVRVGIPGAVMPSVEVAAVSTNTGQVASREEHGERPEREGRRDYSAGRSDFSSPAPIRNAPSESQAQSAKADLEKLLSLMATPGQVELKERAGNTVLNIVSPAHESVLIGRRGQTAEALQHLVLEMMQRREKDAGLYLVVDVADYHGRAEERLIEKARTLAAKVLAEGGEESMGPLSSAERRVVHVELKPMEGIETFSVGNSSTKKLIIKRKS